MWIHEARRRAGLTQAELAKRAGTTQSAIARWESGRSEPSFSKLRRLVRACGLELRGSLHELDPGEETLIERNLTLTPAERLEQLVRTVEFIEAGRAALRGARG
jgi:transcriptional regulator with XRE-family HTH domain